MKGEFPLSDKALQTLSLSTNTKKQLPAPGTKETVAANTCFSAHKSYPLTPADAFSTFFEHIIEVF